MANPGLGGDVASLNGVQLSNPAADDMFMLNATGYWQNMPITNRAATINRGGQESVSAVASATGSVALNLANGNVFDVTLTGATTFSFVGATSGRACSFSLYLHQGSGTAVTWPSSVKWSGGTPALSTTSGAVDILVFESLNGGTSWYGSLVGTNFV